SQVANESAECCLVAVTAQPAHHTDCRTGKYETMTLGLPRMDVGEMYFDERHRHRGERIAQRQAGMRVRSCIDERAVSRAAQLLHLSYEVALAVGLKEVDRCVQLCSDTLEIGLDLG